MAYLQDLSESGARDGVRRAAVRSRAPATLAAHVIFMASVGFAAALVLGLVP